MSTYATRHHPQVQARKAGTFINQWKREHYIQVLTDAKNRQLKKLSKDQLYIMVCDQNLGAEVTRRFTWQNQQ